MAHDETLIKRHEAHFEKIFNAIDDITKNYVRSPTFIVTLVSCVISIVAMTGWIFSTVFSNIDKNEVSILELAKQQVRQEERQEALKNNQDNTITQLIDALKKVNNVTP